MIVVETLTINGKDCAVATAKLGQSESDDW